MKKLTVFASAVVLSTASVMANAAVYDLTGSGNTRTYIDFPGFPRVYTNTLAEQTVTGTANVDDTGGVFNSAVIDYTAVITSPLDANVNTTLTGQFVFADASGAYTDTFLTCTDNGTTSACGDINPILGVVQPVTASTFDFSDLSNITWTLNIWPVSTPLGDAETNASYSLTPGGTIIPVPAAAWLFGSALLGLAGVGRQRKAA